jgi:hypothetical protein
MCRRFMYLLYQIFFTGVVLCAVFYVPARAFEKTPSTRTEASGFDREACIEECWQFYGSGVLGHGTEGYRSLYQKCVDDCEKRYWESWNGKTP